jgi:hypothetical protein
VVIGKVTRGSDVAGLLRYLYGPGRSNEHTDPHLVASWVGDDRAVLAGLEPTAGPTPVRPDVATLAGRLSLPLQLLPDEVDRPVWQCSMRTADGDRRLTDAEWAAVARDVVARVGIAPDGDPGGCRWVAVRHADDHIHIVAVLARQDGQPVRLFRDWPKVHAAARAAEQRFGLQVLSSPDRTAEVDVTRAEVEKATRAQISEPARRWLTRQVRIAAAGSSSRAEFAATLEQAGVTISWRESVRTPGQVTGYAVGRPGDVDGDGRQVWFSGSKLSPDLSLPKLQARWREVDRPSPTPRTDRHRGPLTPEQRRQRLDRAARALGRAVDGPVAPAVGVSAAEVATVVAHAVEGRDGGPLADAARHLARAARRPGGRRPATGHQVHVLRSVATGIAELGHALPGETGDVLLIVGQLARVAAVLHQQGPASQRQAAGQAHRHLLIVTGPPQPAQSQLLTTVLPPPLAEAVRRDPAWPALAARLRQIEASGADTTAALATAGGARELGSARSVAAVLHHRLAVLADPASGPATPQGHRPAPQQTRSPRPSLRPPARTRHP